MSPTDGSTDDVPSRIDPYFGPTEEESLEAIGTSSEEIKRLAEGWGMPSGLEEESSPDDDWESDYTEGSTSAEVLERVRSGMRIWSDEATPEEIAAGTLAEGE